MNLTADEKAIVWRVLNEPARKLGIVFDYGAYILPTLLFAAYGVWKLEFAAMLAAYVSLLIIAVLYLSYAHNASENLRAALKKYEEEVGALENHKSA